MFPFPSSSRLRSPASPATWRTERSAAVRAAHEAPADEAETQLGRPEGERRTAREDRASGPPVLGSLFAVLVVGSLLGAREQDDATAAATFDQAAAITVLTAAAEEASERCARDPGPRGRHPVDVTLVPTGKVKSVMLTSPLAGTQRGNCVIRTVQRASVAPYEGGDETVRVTVMFLQDRGREGPAR